MEKRNIFYVGVIAYFDIDTASIQSKKIIPTVTHNLCRGGEKYLLCKQQSDSVQ